MFTTTGWQRFAKADWAGAREAFAIALAESPSDPEALEGLGQGVVVPSYRAARICHPDRASITRARPGVRRSTT